MIDEYYIDEDYYETDPERYQYDLKYGVTVRDYEHHISSEEQFELTEKEEEWALYGNYTYQEYDDDGKPIGEIVEEAIGEEAKCALLWKKSYLAVKGTPSEVIRLQTENEALRQQIENLENLNNVIAENERLTLENRRLNMSVTELEERVKVLEAITKDIVMDDYGVIVGSDLVANKDSDNIFITFYVYNTVGEPVSEANCILTVYNVHSGDEVLRYDNLKTNSEGFFRVNIADKITERSFYSCFAESGSLRGTCTLFAY